MTSDRVQEQKLHTEQADQDVDTIGHVDDANMHGDDGTTSQSVLSTVSYLVNAYVSGISSSSRAILYFILITYISYNYPMQSSSFIADAKNPLNQYFVKFAWGWTFSAVFLFMVLSNYITTGTWVSNKTFMSSCRLVVGTAVYLCQDYIPIHRGGYWGLWSLTVCYQEDLLYSWALLERI